MVNAFKTAVERVKELPAERQLYAARVLEHIAKTEERYRVPRAHTSAVLKGLKQARQKKYISASAVKKALYTAWA